MRLGCNFELNIEVSFQVCVLHSPMFLFSRHKQTSLLYIGVKYPMQSVKCTEIGLARVNAWLSKMDRYDMILRPWSLNHDHC